MTRPGPGPVDHADRRCHEEPGNQAGLAIPVPIRIGEAVRRQIGTERTAEPIRLAQAAPLLPAGVEEVVPSGSRLYLDVVSALSVVSPAISAVIDAAAGGLVSGAAIESRCWDASYTVGRITDRRLVALGHHQGDRPILRPRGVRFLRVLSDVGNCTEAAAVTAAALGDGLSPRVSPLAQPALRHIAWLWQAQWNEVVAAYIGQRRVERRLVDVCDQVAVAVDLLDAGSDDAEPAGAQADAVALGLQQICEHTAELARDLWQLMTCMDPNAAAGDPNAIGESCW